MTDFPNEHQLPRLLYVGDVPIESTYHGSALLYRLLQDYPAEKLMIVESEPQNSSPKQRLDRVRYAPLPKATRRLSYTRFVRWAGAWRLLTVPTDVVRIRRLAKHFNPQAVLTVAHGYSWMAAASFAERAGLPLHLIVHDDCPSTSFLSPRFQVVFDQRFRQAYRQAASRLCVSPYMEEYYSSLHGTGGQVLYPSRAKDVPPFAGCPATYRKRGGPLVGAFAGNMVSWGYRKLVLHLARCLATQGGSLMLFGPHSRDSLTASDLDRENVLQQGLVSSRDLVRRLHEEADFLFIPMSFERSGDQQNMRLSFPSKLTDYTMTGLPLLICGPEYCSAVRWAHTFPGIAEVVTSEEAKPMEAALLKLEDPKHRRYLGTAALKIGNQLFSHEAAKETLWRALVQQAVS